MTAKDVLLPALRGTARTSGDAGEPVPSGNSARGGLNFVRIDPRAIPEDIEPCSAWTESMLEMAEWIGARATLQLVACFGGIELYVPSVMADDHIIVDAIGIDAARRLAEIYGNERIELSVGRAAVAVAARKHILTDVRAGRMSKQEAAMRLGTSTRYVRQLINTPKAGLIGRRKALQRITRTAQLDLLALIDPQANPEKVKS